MFELLDGSDGKVVGIHASGRLTDSDYKTFIPRIEERIDQHGKIRLLVDMEGFVGWDLYAAWDDFTFGMTHWHHFEKMALVGDTSWEKAAARAADLLMHGEVRFFDLDERDAAWDWIKE
jgi:hypothetical protein